MSSILVQVIVGGLLLGAVYALFSSGLTLIWGMMNIVNFAHGDFVMLGMYVAFVVWTLLGVGPFVGAPVAALVLATLGVIVYFGLIRSVMKGPMLAQILGTFGLALLLRYSVFWGFGANFQTLPENLVGGTFDVFGIRIQASRLLAGAVALLVTLGLHLLLTRTSLGSKMLAVAEDSTAAQLMGIRPDSMQAMAWAIAAAATGIAGALIATFFYLAPTVGQTLGICAFVTDTLGGFATRAVGGLPRRHFCQRADRCRDRRADATAVRSLFQHGHDSGRRTGQTGRHQHRISRSGSGPQRSDRAADRARPLLYLGAALLLSVPRGSRDHARHHLVDGEQPDGILSPRDQGLRARRALARRSRKPHQALRLHAERRTDQRRRCALCDDVRLRRSGFRAWHPDFREDPDHGGARRPRPVVRPPGRCFEPRAAGRKLQQPARRQRRRADLRRLRRDHRLDRPLSTRRHFDAYQAAMGAARQNAGGNGRSGSNPCSLRPAM